MQQLWPKASSTACSRRKGAPACAEPVPLSAQHRCSDVKLPSGSEPGSAKGPPYPAVLAQVWRAMLREVRQVTELFQAFWQQAPAKAYLQQLL